MSKVKIRPFDLQNIKVQFYKNNKGGINYVREEKVSH